MRLFVAFIAVLAASVSFGQDWAKKRIEASPRHLEWVEVANGARKVKCFVAYPERKDKAAVVVLIHEIFGMTDWVQSVADQLAEHGYIAIAPDLLSGMGPNGGRSDSFAEGKAREAVSGLTDSQVTADLNAVCEHAKKIPSANGKLAVAGFCWGGGKAFAFATSRKDLSAAFVFYGVPAAAPDMPRITAPVYGFYGGNDNRINATIPDTEKAMKEAGKKYDPMVYEGAGHGFMRAGEDPDGQAANKKAREEAWKRMLGVLGKV